MLAGQVAGALSRKSADQVLCSSERRDGSILASFVLQIVVLNREGIVVVARNYWSEKFLRNASFPFLAAAIGSNYLEAFESASGKDAAKAAAGSGIRAVCEGAQDCFEMEYPCQNGKEQHWFAMTVLSLMDSCGTVVVTHRNISKDKQTKQVISELSGKLIRAQEEERRRIARELHDDICQQLALLAIDLRRVQRSDVKPLAVTIQELCKKVDDISNELRRISHRLHSTKLDHLGLVTALRSLCEEFSEQYDLTIDFQLQPVPATLDADISLNFFRIAQEALRNVARHSNATNVRVELTCSTSELSLRVSDDGVGFDCDSIKGRDGLGVMSMQERMRSIGGILTIGSKPSQGTLLEARLPLRRVPSARGDRSAFSAA